MFKVLAVPMLALALSACSMSMMAKPTDYTLGKQPAGNALNSSGTVSVSHSGNMVMTTAKVMGLAPNTYYVAHYHLQGAASTDACASGGTPIMSSKIVGMSDAMGMLTLTGSVAAADVMSATYFNIHTASDAAGTPADAGISCTAIAKMM
ncbi:superoxide dismutase [Deinococcus sp. KSM4-11]|uniref:superoxide dismutase n=1 Tax=Deinococcus sp. KSM4-11 TaxID=2568654 RepID=UPI0010A461F5|nr:superoxide dismutase [Deinococcus sp. KSM4-11]THF85043.1 superoxide dismutase [Deinococcus sp. KSM4-11]